MNHAFTFPAEAGPQFTDLEGWMSRPSWLVTCLDGLPSDNATDVYQVILLFDMPSDLWRKRVTNFESNFTAFYLKV